jgi:hypothetical protein
MRNAYYIFVTSRNCPRARQAVGQLRRSSLYTIATCFHRFTAHAGAERYFQMPYELRRASQVSASSSVTEKTATHTSQRTHVRTYIIAKQLKLLLYRSVLSHYRLGSFAVDGLAQQRRHLLTLSTCARRVRGNLTEYRPYTVRRCGHVMATHVNNGANDGRHGAQCQTAGCRSTRPLICAFGCASCPSVGRSARSLQPDNSWATAI